MGFTGMRCLVTGTGSGVGAAVAAKLRSSGASVVSLDRVLPAVPVDEHHLVDLAEKAELDGFLRATGGQWDAVCNAAGTDDRDPPQTVLQVNFYAIRHICESIVPHMSGGGSIVNVGSMSAHHWPQHLEALRELMKADDAVATDRWLAEHGGGRGAEAISKEAIVAYTKSRGPELIDRGLRMNAVSPGPVDTPLQQSFRESMADFYGTELDPSGVGTAPPSAVAELIVFLMSSASALVNGHNLVADGGVMGRGH